VATQKLVRESRGMLRVAFHIPAQPLHLPTCARPSRLNFESETVEMKRTLCVLAVIVLICPAVVRAQSAKVIEYDVSFPERESHYIEVRLRIQAAGSDSIDLMMPTWTPGSYLIREYARQVDRISAITADQSPATVVKSNKNRWQVKSGVGKDILVTYRLYCHEMSVRSNWVDRDMAILSGAATFLTIADQESRIHQVRFHLPESWTRTVTSMKAVDGSPHTYRAENFDELVDSPILCGDPVVQDFTLGGADHVLASLGDSSLWDTAKAAADVQKVVAQQQAFWGSVPYSRYCFLNVISESGGGLEHDNSTLVMTSRWNFRDKEKYEDWLSLISHEFFHTWNVRRLRPAELTRYQYETETNTRSLWIAEGITSYYEDLMLIRAGLIDQPAYLKRLSKNIEKLQTNPGRNVQSLAESSFDTWTKFYRPDENSLNTRTSYYVKGCVVAFLLDAKIRELTNDARSLDDVMRLLYQRHAGAKGYSNADFTLISSEVAGSDLTAWLAQAVESTEELNYEQALNWFGLQFPMKSGATPAEATTENPADKDARSTDTKAGDSTPQPQKAAIWLGIQVPESGSSLTVTGVASGSPAMAAGVNIDDELLAFDGYRVNSRTWKEQLRQLGVGKQVQLLISRRGRIQTLEITLAADPSLNWLLKPAATPADAQKLRIAKWLGSPPTTK
jgi:predicted metalloprotease with PDZ domain